MHLSFLMEVEFKLKGVAHDIVQWGKKFTDLLNLFSRDWTCKQGAGDEGDSDGTMDSLMGCTNLILVA